MSHQKWNQNVEDQEAGPKFAWNGESIPKKIMFRKCYGPPKTNMESENHPEMKRKSSSKAPFLVSGR